MTQPQDPSADLSSLADHWIAPDWPSPPGVRACTTTRFGGASVAPYEGLNLADHVGDDPSAVVKNRRLLSQALALPGRPCWLRQVHGSRVHLSDEAGRSSGPAEADASLARDPNRVCAVLTADCVPVLLCNRAGTRVGAVHAGWRGLAAGVVQAALAAWQEPARGVMAWIGPSIGRDRYEVGDEVRQALVARDKAATAGFSPLPGGRWLADLHLLVRHHLKRCGVRRIYGGDLCTYSDPGRFYSYRRDGITGRMASLIWIEDPG